MFQITFLVEDKKLPLAMHAVNGIALNLQVVPISHAKADRNGKVRSTAPLDTYEAIKQAIKQDAGLLKFTTKELNQIVVEAGGSVGSRVHYTNKLIKDKILKRTKERGKYAKV